MHVGCNVVDVVFLAWISYFGPEVVGSFNYVRQVAPTAQEQASHVGTRANISRFRDGSCRKLRLPVGICTNY